MTDAEFIADSKILADRCDNLARYEGCMNDGHCFDRERQTESERFCVGCLLAKDAKQIYALCDLANGTV